MSNYDKAIAVLRSIIVSKYATVDVPLGSMTLHYQAYADAEKLYNKLISSGLLEIKECHSAVIPGAPPNIAAQEICDVELSHEGSKYFAKRGAIRNDLFVKPPVCLYDQSMITVVGKCVIYPLKAASFDVGIISGIADTPYPNMKVVDYTVTSNINSFGMAMGLLWNSFKEHFVAAQFQKYDDGWRLLGSPVQ